MNENVDRVELAAILERLGAGDDAEVLSAAREAHAKISTAGISWMDLLDQGHRDDHAAWDEDSLADGTGETESDDEPSDTGDDTTDMSEQTESGGSSASRGGSNADTLRLLDRLLVHEKNDPYFCTELEGYKQDIANGVFDDRDRTYVRDLYDRLRKSPLTS